MTRAGTPRAAAAAYSLAELMAVLAITAVVLAVGAARFSRASIFMADGERVARQLVADLRWAQSQAITDGTPHSLEFASPVDGKLPAYAIFRKGSPGVKLSPTRTLPDSVAVTSDATEVLFYPGGDADADHEITVTAAGRKYLISVTLATGAVALEDTTP